MSKRINGKNFDILSNVKSTYKHIYPQDKDAKYIKDNITFANVLAEMQNGNDFYDITFTDQYSDSLMRERIFTILSKVSGVDYDKIYYMWLNNEHLTIFKGINLHNSKIYLNFVV